MVRKALIIDNEVFEIKSADPFPPFHPRFNWVECEDLNVKIGWLYENGEFIDPHSIVNEETIKQRIHDLWEAAHKYVLDKIDMNARSKYLMMLTQDSTTQSQRDKINQNSSWSDSVWMGYAQRKAQILSNPEEMYSVSIDFSNYGNPPYDFWDIVS